MADDRHVAFAGNIVMLGFGSVGQAMLPLLFRHIDIDASRVKVVTAAADDMTGIASEYAGGLMVQPLTEGNFEAVLDRLLKEGDFLLNLSVDVSSLALIRYCWRRGILCLDTCIEPWEGRYTDPSLPLSKRSNYSLREEVPAFRLDKRHAPTAIVTAIARDLAIKVIHIAERDTQISGRRKLKDEFVKTWSVDGFVGEGLQPSEILDRLLHRLRRRDVVERMRNQLAVLPLVRRVPDHDVRFEREQRERRTTLSASRSR